MEKRFASNGMEANALQRILETTHSLQMRVFRATMRGKLNSLSVDEFQLAANAISDAITDLRATLE